MPNVIACRLASYGTYQDRAWSHLPQIGIRHVEIPAPALHERDTTKKKLADHGLTACSLQALCDISKPDAVNVMRPQLETCAEFNARICFVSIKAGDTDRSLVWDRLRAIGDIAGQLGLTVAMETHPDLITNGEVARETMTAIDHPHVRVNFDTGNVYFYNENRTALAELERIIDYVVAVHIKDSAGGYQEWNFPTLGTGVVDFPAIFGRLNARGFTGPFTMELEGTKGIERDEAAQLQYIADSVAYLRQIGAFD